MKTLIHFGCSFAVGNAIPKYVEGLPSGAYVHASEDNKLEFKKKYNLDVQYPVSCGMVIAESLGYNHTQIAENGASNEMIFRNLLQADLDNSFVLIGLTSYNRREALTTAKRRTHWHTWKMVEPNEPPKYKNLPFTAWGKEFTPAIEEDGQIRTVIQILYMQAYLKSKQVPYLMFNALYNGFDIPLTRECKKMLKMVDKKYFYNLQGTDEDCQHGWCLEKKLVVSDLDTHPNVQGQQAWAQELLPQIKDILDNGN